MEVLKAFDLNLKNSLSITKLSNLAKKGGVEAALMIPHHKPIYNKLQLAYNLTRAKEENFNLFVAIEGIYENKLSEISILKKKGASAIFINSDEDMNLIKRVFEYSEFLDIPIFVNCNNKFLSSGVMNDSEIAYKLGVNGIANYAESIEVAKIYELSKHFNAKVVFQSITTKESIEILKNKPKNIFIDVAIDNLFFSDEKLENFNTIYKTFPPLRSEEDRLALIEACKEEIIDFISSNHISTKLKDIPFEEAEFGIEKLDIFVPLAYSLPLPYEIVEKLISINPAKLFNYKIKEKVKIEFEETKTDNRAYPLLKAKLL